jgi:hypothetical protein
VEHAPGAVARSSARCSTCARCSDPMQSSAAGLLHSAVRSGQETKSRTHRVHRKLLIMLNAMIRHQTMWHGCRSFDGSALPFFRRARPRGHYCRRRRYGLTSKTVAIDEGLQPRGGT